MTGVVLCGGQSTRMGRDKGLVLQQQITWAELAAGKLKQLNIPVVLSVNEQQYETYKSLIKDQQFINDDDELQIGGPLKGILSVHIKLPLEDLLVLACDMPGMKAGVLIELINVQRSKQYEAYVFRNGEQVEPLCATYTAGALRKVYERYLSGTLHQQSMLSFIESCDTCYLPVWDLHKDSFRNYNFPHDVEGL